MAIARTELEYSLHRLANHIECRLAEFISELLADGRSEAVTSLAFAGCRFIDTLREVRDGREGGAE
jgi:hypothetical protein